MKVSILGVGYVGLVTAACFAEIGHEVLCFDIDKAKIQKLQKNISPIYEADLTKLIKKNQKRLKFSVNIRESIEFGDVVFCAVGTPIDKNADMRLLPVKNCARNFAKYLNRDKIFVIKSTVPIGTSQFLKNFIQAEINKQKKSFKFEIASNPEFLREGSAIKDTLHPNRIVIGTKSKSAIKIMKNLYAPITRTGCPLLIVKETSAELIKYASNAFLSTKISFINEIANFSELVSADIKEVAKGLGLDKRIGQEFLNAGLGFGGSCFPKDIKALISQGNKCNYNFKILKAVESVNINQKEILIKKLKEIFPTLKSKTIAIWGLSFKPGTDDIREAPSISIIKKLLEENVQIKTYDPVASQNVKKILKSKNIICTKNKEEALKNAEALLIVTEWDEFKNFPKENFLKLMKNPIILDGRNIFKPKDFQNSSIKYFSIGQN
ncbi:hypothetical protein A2272_00470 [Candidatus Peregrinibacteria bacterium RIFOXYA12_FULL_33_12]|nr:MAG: hypothetical protein A2272_00470 [Candidatus Peregrinibacteria bacterium RIFOXYA12_FULL_33_12]